VSYRGSELYGLARAIAEEPGLSTVVYVVDRENGVAGVRGFTFSDKDGKVLTHPVLAGLWGCVLTHGRIRAMVASGEADDLEGSE
jgi:hypothetical protein